jgi:hypothetical protein
VRYLGLGKRRFGREIIPAQSVENIPRTEHEEARRAARDWLRDRTDDDVPEFEVDDQWDAI